MPPLVERPVDGAVFTPGWVALDMRGCAEVIANVLSRLIVIVGRIHDNETDALQAFDYSLRLRAKALLAGGDDGSDRQPKGIGRRMDFRGRAAFGSANTGSFKPLLRDRGGVCFLQMVAPIRTNSKSGSAIGILK